MSMRRSKGNYRDSTVDPPAQAIGAMAERAPVDNATGGSGFTHLATAWDVLAGQPECITDLQDFLRDIDENPNLRSAATLRSLGRLRAELEKVPETCGLSDPVVLKVQDVVLLARQLMQRLR